MEALPEGLLRPCLVRAKETHKRGAMHGAGEVLTRHTFWRVSCFSGSVSFCALTVPILTLKNLEWKLLLYRKLSLSLMSLLIGSFFSTFLPCTSADTCQPTIASNPSIHGRDHARFLDA